MGERKSIVVKAIRRILDPLVRILLRFDISHSEFAEIAKRSYVDVAYKYFSIPKRKMTFSRVSVLTGLTRKEVVRLTKRDEAEIPKTKGSINRATLVIGGWIQDQEFSDEEKQPLELPLKGEGASFESLVSRYSGDITARAILDELVRVKAVEITAEKKVRLLQQAFIPEHDEIEQLEMVSKHTGDVMGTSIHNITHDKADARFQREVVYCDMSEKVAEEFKEYSAKRSMDLLVEFNEWLATKNESEDNKNGEKVERVGVGIYFFKNDKEKEEELQNEKIK